MKATVSLLLSCLLLCSGVDAEDSVEFTPQATTLWTLANDVVSDATNAYVLLAEGLEIIDVSTLSAPTFVSRLRLDGDARGIFRAGTLLYIADYNRGLIIVDASSVSAPFLRSVTPLSYSPTDVTVVGATACLSATEVGLITVDISDPDAPSELGYLTTYDNTAFSVVVDDTLAFIADPFGFTVATIADPSNPIELVPYFGGTCCGWDVSVRNDTGFVAFNGTGQFHVVDIFGGGIPFEIGVYEGGNMYNPNVHVDGNSAFIASALELHVVDISDPESPDSLAVLEHGFGPLSATVTGLQRHGNHLLSTHGSRGLLALDISTPESPSRTGQYNLPGVAEQMLLRNNIAFILDRHACLRTVDLSIPTSPNTLDSHCPGLFSANALAQAGDYAFTGCGNTIWCYDVSDPAGLSFIGQYDFVSAPSDIALRDTILYFTIGDNTLNLVNIANPDAPTEIGATTISDGQLLEFLEIQGDFAYLAGAMGQFRIVDISDPAAIVTLGGLQFAGTVWDLEVSDTLAVVLADDLHIISIADPNAPAKLSSIDTLDVLNDAAFSGKIIHVAASDQGLVAYDLSDPTSPTPAAVYDPDLAVGGVAVEDTLLLMATSSVHVMTAKDLTASCCRGMRGNVNGDDSDLINIVDMTFLVAYLFQGGAEPPCLEEANVNGSADGVVNIIDMTVLVAYLFQSGPSPAGC